MALYPRATIENSFGGESNAGAWLFNDATPQRGKAANREILKLKNEIEDELKVRYRAEARKMAQSIQVERDSLQRKQQDASKSKSISTIKVNKQAADQYDAANFKELNRRLAAEQSRNGQLGAGQAWFARHRQPQAQAERVTAALEAMTASMDSNKCRRKELTLGICMERSRLS